MGRVRFVQPKVVRLYLVDGHRRAHQALLERTKPARATAEEIAHSAAAVASAEADGAFIDIKNELTAGEEREALARMTKVMEAGRPPQFNPAEVELSTMVAYLVGWSFTDAQGQPVPVTDGAITSLDAETFDEIWSAIQHHERALADEKKKARRVDAPVSSTT